jgi:ribose transport system ATP-binding protein
MSDNPPLLQVRNVCKTFGSGTVALRGVDLDVAPGKVHGLLGANGAGKSTLIKILSGAFPASSGELIWNGRPVQLDGPKQANDLGIATIHQHIPLVSTLSVIENVFLGANGFWRRDPSARSRFAALCARVGYRLDPDAIVGELSIGQRQMVAIFQALGSGARLIVMDEPTASLATDERELVYRTVRRLSQVEGKAILFVSHFLDEVMALTDCVTVLRDGRAVLTADTNDLDEEKIAEAIVGRRLAALEREARNDAGRPPRESAVAALLEIRDLASAGKLAPATLTIAAGEVVGVAGLLGSGRSELLHAIFGADAAATGEVLMDGRVVPRSTVCAVQAGLALVPEDRRAQGLVSDFEIWRNATLPALERVSLFGLFPIRGLERRRGADAIRDLGIKADSPDSPVSQLSGGNAQKVSIAKWLYSDAKVFLLDEPTAGIDIGAKADILVLIRKLAAAGKAIVVVSSEFEELLAVCHRILVMRDGKCVAERLAHDTSEHELVLLAGGQTLSDAEPGLSHQGREI